jgi:prolyl-tRNA synthetase
MGSYGIGPSRLMGLLAEHFADEKGLVWPENVAPAKVYLANMGPEVVEAATELYDKLVEAGVEVIFDDRDVRPGQKFADSELMGIPYRITVGKKSLEQEKYELTTRLDGSTELLTGQELLDKLS